MCYQLVGSVCELTKKLGLTGGPISSIFLLVRNSSSSGGLSLIGADSPIAILPSNSGRCSLMVATKLFNQFSTCLSRNKYYLSI